MWRLDLNYSFHEKEMMMWYDKVLTVGTMAIVLTTFRCVKSTCCTSEMYTMLYVKYTPIKIKMKINFTEEYFKIELIIYFSPNQVFYF